MQEYDGRRSPGDLAEMDLTRFCGCVAARDNIHFFEQLFDSRFRKDCNVSDIAAFCDARLRPISECLAQNSDYSTVRFKA